MLDTLTATIAPIISLGILAGLIVWRQRLAAERRKLELIARSFLSWFTLGTDHSPDHVNLAETLFVSKTRRDQLASYELMGYFAKDVQILQGLDERRRLMSALPQSQMAPNSLQYEYLMKYKAGALPVLMAIVTASNSRYFRELCAQLFAPSPEPVESPSPSVIKS